MCKKIYLIGIVFILSFNFMFICPSEAAEYLDVTVPDEVFEGDEFMVTVTNGSVPIEGASIIPEWEYIFTLGGGTYLTNEDGEVNLTATYVESDRQYHLEVIHSGYLLTTVYITVKNIEPSVEKKHFIIDVAPSVNENNEFTLSIINSELWIRGAGVVFNGKSLKTDTLGDVVLMAPDVDSDTEYPITVSKEGYHDSELSIIVLNVPKDPIPDPEPQIPTYEYIFGSVNDVSGIPIEGANVCVMLSGETIGNCQTTDDEGIFNITVEPGTYVVNASKDGYITSTVCDIVVLEDASVEVPFILEEFENQLLIEEAIQSGAIGGEVTFEQGSDDIHVEKIIYANISINSTIDPEQNKILLAIGGTESKGKTIIVTIDKTIFSLDDIQVEYDSIVIEKADDLSDALDAEDDGSLPECYVIENMVFISIPQFSEHVVTISAVEEIVVAVGGPMMLISYIAICLIGASVFIYPIFAWTIRIKRRKNQR